MPLWNIKHTPSLFSPTEKESVSKAATSIYKAVGLPAFYVQVIFEELPPQSIYLGGEEHKTYASIEIHHIARSIRDADTKKIFLDNVDKIFNPLLVKKGAKWEYFVSESERDMWKINGVYPPAAGSDEEKKWAEVNRQVKLDGTEYSVKI
jgi:phenylpyruvate tautomerase PptA (4-oxalocrotonate tautomerase family)